MKKINENAIIKTVENRFLAQTNDSEFECLKKTNGTLIFTIGDAINESSVEVWFTKADAEKFIEWINGTTF